MTLPRGRHQLSRDQVADAQRDRMIHAMAEAMAEHGYVRTPVAEIIKRAGVSRETFYQQFTSKQDCFIAALEQTIGRLAELMLAASPAVDTPMKRFDRLLGVYLDALASEPATARLFLVEVYAAGPEVARRRIELQRQFADRLVRIFGARSKSARFACEALVASIISMVTTRVVDNDIQGLRSLHEPIVELVRRGLEAHAYSTATMLSGR